MKIGFKINVELINNDTKFDNYSLSLQIKNKDNSTYYNNDIIFKLCKDSFCNQGIQFELNQTINKKIHNIILNILKNANYWTGLGQKMKILTNLY